MKKTIVITILIFGCWHSFPQDFVNLNLQDATIIPDPSSGYYPEAVYASDAIPGWTVTGCFLGPNDVVYGCISIYCNFSLAPGFSPVGVVGPTASRFNGLVTAARKTVETVPIFSIRYSPG
jgi:hypothetical protein